MAAFLHSEVSRATAACASWKNEAKRLTKDVAEQSTKRIAGGNSLRHSLTTPAPGENLFVTFLRQQKEVIHHYMHLDPQTAFDPWRRNASTCTALSDTRSVTDESTEAEKFECEPRQQASKLKSWNLFFRREVIPGSNHLRIVSDWLAEIDVAASMAELDHSGFVFKIARGSMKNVLAELKRKVNFLEETQCTKTCPMLAGRQADGVPTSIKLWSTL